MRAQSLEEQCKNISTQFLQLRSKRYLLCLGSPFLLCFLKLPSTSNKQTKPQTFLFPLISYLNIYSCGIFHIKGEVGKGFKNLSSTNHFFSAHPPFPFFGGGHQLSTLVSTTHTREIRTKRQIHTTVLPSLLFEPFGATTPDLQSARKKREAVVTLRRHFYHSFSQMRFPDFDFLTQFCFYCAISMRPQPLRIQTFKHTPTKRLPEFVLI